LIQEDIDNFNKAVKICSFSQEVKDVHIKNALVKIADNYIQNIKTAGLFTWLGDLARGAWSQLWSPFSNLVDKGAFRRLHTNIQNEFSKTLNYYLMKLVENKNPDKIKNNVLIYLKQMMDYYRKQGSEAVRSNNVLNQTLSQLMVLAINSFFEHLKREGQEVPFVALFKQ
jgi:hypothetical protein